MVSIRPLFVRSMNRVAAIGVIERRRRSDGAERHPGGRQAMRVMVLIKATQESEAGVMPDQRLLTEMGAERRRAQITRKP
jgi:hypothetical protein